MKEPGGTLEDLLSSLEGPLRFLAQADPTQRARTHLPIDAWLGALASRQTWTEGEPDGLSRLALALGGLRGTKVPTQASVEAVLAALGEARAAPRPGLPAAFDRCGPQVSPPLRAVAPSRPSQPREISVLVEGSLPLGAVAATAPAKKHAGSRSAGAAVAQAKAAPATPKTGLTTGAEPLPGASAAMALHLAALAAGVATLPGVGRVRATQLEAFGLATVEDLLYHLPFRYDDRRQRHRVADLAPGEVGSVVVEIVTASTRVAGRFGRRLLSAVASDESGRIELVWFNQVRWFERRLLPGSRWLAHGRLEGGFGGLRQMVHPEMAPIEESETEATATGQLLPVYEKPTALTVLAMRRLVAAALASLPGAVPEVLPVEVRARLALLPLDEAFRMLHQPPAESDAADLLDPESAARRALVFDEFLFVQLGMLQRRAEVEASPGLAIGGVGELNRRLLERLPFQPTSAQVRVVAEIHADMARPRPMHRLLQGDVGTGKTLVAVQAALTAIEAGFQVAIMAPTELLAEQHWRTVQNLLEGMDVPHWRLTGDLGARERRAVLADLAEVRPGLVVGTHALVQQSVRFGCLGLAVVDEQHRFGVLQRAALISAAGGVRPDMLLMTATPIPRTLALTVYGDLDVSTLDMRPPGRKPITTRIVPESRRDEAYARLAEEVALGRQAYVVLPLVESSENSDLRDAVSVGAELAARFPALRIAVVHGRIPGEEREGVMRGFRDGNFDVLVATTVIEVGIDVANASFILIEHAERFGLSQLHQLRGRVGRGFAAATCLLLTGFAQTNVARERLRAMIGTEDGLAIAEADLAIRGPGAMLGTRQAGEPDFRVASLLRDSGLLGEARALAQGLLQGDAGLTRPGAAELRAVLQARQAGRHALAQIG